MAKKIKRTKELTEEEKKAEEQKAAEEAAKAAAGIQDEFQARGFELVEWVQEKQAYVLGFIGLVLAAGLAYGIYTVASSSRNTSASVDLQKGLEAYDSPIGEEKPDGDAPHYKDATERSKAARDLFTKAYDGHKGTGAGAVAELYAGHASLKLGEYDAAITHYDAFISNTDKDDPLKFAGYSGLAAAKDAKGYRKGAIAALEALVALPDKIDEDAALLELGRLYQQDGAVDKARAALERIGK